MAVMKKRPKRRRWTLAYIAQVLQESADEPVYVSQNDFAAMARVVRRAVKRSGLRCGRRNK